MLKKINRVKFFVVLATIIFALISITACDNKNENCSLPDVAEGNEFEVILDAYGSTAYQWNYEIKPTSGIEYVSMDYVPANDDPDWTGGGQVVYTFKAVKKGDYKIKFELSVPGESEPPIESKTYTVKIVAK